MAEMQPIKIAVTGAYRQAEFRDLFTCGSVSFERVPCDVLLNSESSAFDIIVFAQSRRGQISESLVRRLWERFPLVERVLVFGSWCEGETRSGAPVSNVKRIPVRDWSAWLENWLAAKAGKSGVAMQPVSFNRADELMHASIIPSVELAPLKILVAATCPGFVGSIQAVGHSLGWQTDSLGLVKWSSASTPSKNWDLLVCECHYSIDEVAEWLRQYPELRTLPIAVVLGFPRQQDRQVLQELGIEFELVGKPFGNEILFSSIRRFLQNRKLNVVSEVA